MVWFTRSAVLVAALLAAAGFADAARSQSPSFVEDAWLSFPAARPDNDARDGAKKAMNSHDEEPAEGRPVRPGDER